MKALRLIVLSVLFAPAAAWATDLSLRMDRHMPQRPPQQPVSSSQSKSMSVSNANAHAHANSKSNSTSSSSSSSRGGSAVGIGGSAVGVGGSAVGVGSQGQSISVDSHAVHQAQDRNPVSSAVAPALMTSNDTCMGSTSVGASAVSFGLSVGSTWTDNNCLMLKNARELWNMGFKGAALARLCMDDLNREALESAGLTCPARRAKVADNTGDQTNDIYRY